MTRTVVVAGILFTILALVAIEFTRDDTARGVEASFESSPPPASDPTTAQLASEEADSPAQERERVPSAELMADEAHIPEVPAENPNAAVGEKLVAGAVLRGRFLLSDDRPAAGVELALQGWPANNERTERHGLPKGWKNPRGVTQADGRFEISFDPPQAYQFVLDAKLEGYPEESWRWGRIEPDAVVDVGEVRLRRSGTIVGRIVDGAGNPLQVGWMVYADAPPSSYESGRDKTRVMEPSDPATGTFRIEDVPVGPVTLKAHGKLVNWVDGPSVDVEADRVTEAVIRYADSDPSQRITIVIFTRFHAFNDRVESILLLRDGHEVAQARKIPGSSQSFAFDDIPEGDYEVVIEDPKFERWSRQGVQPGQEIRAHLRGGAGLSLTVVDAESGAVLPRYRAEFEIVFPDGWSSSANSVVLQKETRPPPEDGIISDVLAIDGKLHLSASGHADLEIPLDGLAAGEVRDVRAELARGQLLSGVVLLADGTPASDAFVDVVAPEADLGDLAVYRKGGSTSNDDPRVAEAECGSGGRFEIDSLRPGSWWVVAVDGRGIEVRETVVLEEGVPVDVELRLPAVAALEGRVLMSAELPTAGLAVSARDVQEDEMSFMRGLLFEDGHEAELQADGSFRIENLTVGEWAVFLELRGPSRRGFRTMPVDEAEMGRIHVTSAETLRREFDLVELEPGLLRVEVQGEEARLRGAQLSFARLGEEFGSSFRVDLDPRTPVVEQRLFPGQYVVALIGPQERWRDGPDAPHEVFAGQRSRYAFELTVELVDGELEVLDEATGKPLASSMLVWNVVSSSAEGGEDGGMEDRGGIWNTDERGLLRGPLMPGTYVFSTMGSDAQPVSVVWGPAGPDPALIRLPAQDF